jgi:hypothetical protein
MGKRFAIVIGVAAAGVMALGAQTATSSTVGPVDRTPPDLQLSGPKKQNPTIRPGSCPGALSCRACDGTSCDVIVKASCGDEKCHARATGKLTKVKKEKLATWHRNRSVIHPGETDGLELRVPKKARIQAGKALAEGKKVEAKVTVHAKDAAGNVTTAKRTIRFVKGARSMSLSFSSPRSSRSSAFARRLPWPRKRTKVPTSATIKFTGTAEGGLDIGGFVNGTFSGELRAKAGDTALDSDQRQHAGECLKQRKVVLYKKPMRGLPARRAGVDRSNNRGRYRIEARGNAIWLWVQAKKKIIENDGEKVVCKKGASKKKLVTRLPAAP